MSTLSTIMMETQSVSLVASNSATISYSFPTIPKITATSNQNVNIYIKDVTLTECTIITSAKITGTVNVHIMAYE